MKIDQYGSWKAKVGSLAGIALLAVFVGCGGNNPSSMPVATPNVVVSVSPTSGTVQTGSTQQFSASVTGTSNTTVTWSVNGVVGGSDSVGIISTAGLYTAPATIPTPSTVKISAMSAVDTTKSASSSLTVKGTIETATQTVTAANGGAIMLPSGSSVTIPAGAFASDETVTASLLTSPPTQPPNSAIVSVGPALVLSTTASPFNTTASNIQFVINTTTNPAGLEGSAPMADLIDSTGDNFFGLAGSFDSNTNLATIIVPGALMNGTKSVVASMVNLSPANAGQSSAASETSSGLLATAAEPPVPGQLLWDGAAWVPYPGNCPAAPGSKILVLVHGLASSLEQAFSDTAPDGTLASCVNPIKQAGNYALVVGFDYDFTSDIAKNSGPLFASFLNTLAACGDQIDVEAHSEGGPVAAYGITQAQPQAQGLITNFIGLGNPWNGTPLADPGVTIQGFDPLLTSLLNLDLSGSFKGATIQSWLTGPFARQLLPPVLPSSNPGVLDAIQQTLGQRAQHLNMILACGIQPRIGDGTRVLTMVSSLFRSPIGTPNDGLVGLNSCQGLANSAATGQPESVFAGITPNLLMPGGYPISHRQLPCAHQVIADVGKAVNPGGPPPTPPTPTPTPPPPPPPPPSQQIGVNGANVSYLGGSVSCTNTGGFFDNCSGTVSLDVEVSIENGIVGVTMDHLTFAGGNLYSAHTVPGPVVFSLSGPLLQGTCTAGVIHTDIVVLDGFANGINVTIGLATPPTSSVPLTISCEPGS